MIKTDLDIQISRFGSTPIVVLSGDIDAYTCLTLRQAVADLIDEGYFRIVINLSDVKYVDSSGLGTLVGALRRTTERNGDLVLSGASSHLRKVLNITGLDKILATFPSDRDAIKELSGYEVGLANDRR
jgi:anti-sigma B factor antagonist